MDYKPRTEREIKDSMVLSPGEYDFEIETAVEKTSKKGNDMIEMQVRIFCPDGTTRLLRDWLVAGGDLGELKINHFVHATGLQDCYFAGNFSALDCEGACGRLRLTITSSEQYGDQNSVKDYIVAKTPDDEMAAEAEKPQGVPAKQTKRAKKAADANAQLQEAGYENDDAPF